MKKAKQTVLKRTLNLAVKERNRENDPRLIIPVALVLVVGIAAFAKFAVADRLKAASSVYSEINGINAQTQALAKENEQYDSVKEQYSHYTYSIYTNDELALADASRVMNIIDESLLPNSQVASFVFTSNVLNVVINNVTLQDVSAIVSDLYKDSSVKQVTVSTAFTETGSQKATANMTVDLKSAYNGGEAK